MQPPLRLHAPRVRAALLLGVLLVPVLAWTGPANAETSDAQAERLEARLGVSLGGLALEASSWERVQREDHVVLTLRDAAPGREHAVRWVVDNVPAFGFEVRTTEGAHVDLTLDGTHVRSFGPSLSEAFDIGLDEGAHTLAWRARTETQGAAIELKLWGVRTLLAPRIAEAPRFLAGCVLPDARLVLESAAPLLPASIDARLDGMPLPATMAQVRSGLTTRATLSLDLPTMPEGYHFPRLVLRVQDATGTAWNLTPRLLPLRTHLDLDASPDGWAYDLQPTIRLSSWGCRPDQVESIQFLLDGEDRTEALEGTAPNVAYRFPDVMPFGERHSYRFDVTLVDGTRVRREGEFRQGLDVMDFPLAAGSLTFASDAAGALFAPPAGMAPVATTHRVLPPMRAQLDVPEGAFLRATYAPLALRCLDAAQARACSPYGGDAPGFAASALSATLSLRNGEEELGQVPGAGQFALAAHLSGVSPDVLPPALPLTSLR